MMGLLRWLLLIGGCAYLAITVFMYLQQRSLQYFPGRTAAPPEAFGLSGVTVERIAEWQAWRDGRILGAALRLAGEVRTTGSVTLPP